MNPTNCLLHIKYIYVLNRTELILFFNGRKFCNIKKKKIIEMNESSLLCNSQAIDFLFSVLLNEDSPLMLGTECQQHIKICSKLM